jgi:acyl carrier protein
MNNDHKAPKERLRAFIAENFYIPDGQALGETTSFLEQGIIDSTGVLEIVTFVESEFGIAVSDDELLPSNFDSLAALSSFIRRKQEVRHVLAG